MLVVKLSYDPSENGWGRKKKAANKIELSEVEVEKVNCRTLEKPNLMETYPTLSQSTNRIINTNNECKNTPPNRSKEVEIEIAETAVTLESSLGLSVSSSTSSSRHGETMSLCPRD